MNIELEEVAVQDVSDDALELAAGAAQGGHTAGGMARFGPDEDLAPAPGVFSEQLSGVDPQLRRSSLYAALAQALAADRWDGDRDSLNQQPDPRDWATVAAERHT